MTPAAAALTPVARTNRSVLEESIDETGVFSIVVLHEGSQDLSLKFTAKSTAAIRDRVQAQLRQWIARTERPTGNRRATTLDTATSAFRVLSDDFAGFVALRRVANPVRHALRQHAL